MDLEDKNKFSKQDEIHAGVDKIDEIEPPVEMEKEMLSDKNFPPNRSNETVNDFKENLTPERMDEETCYEAFKSTDKVNGKMLPGEIDDQILSNECFEQTKKDVIIKNKYNNKSSNKMDDEVVSNEFDGEIISEMDIAENQTDSEMDCMKNSLLDCIAKSDGFFKSQQVGEPDLTFTEKREIAGNLLIKNLPLFLERYWKFIKIEDISYFDAHRSDYEVNFYVNEIMKMNSTRTKKVRIKNRRYEALKRMVDEGSYFSDAEMKKRNPFLYDQMIGQHLTEKERMDAYKEQYPDKNFSAFLLNQMEKNVENCLFEKQKTEDEAIVEEDDDDSEEDESELEDDEPVKKVVTADEKKQLRSEFTNIMYESFLDGKDNDFDYSSVDNNVDYDSIHQRDIDEQEKYFDEESSHSSD